MKHFLKNILFRGSFIVFLGSLITGLFNYLYHLITGRMFTPSQYGLLESLIALSYFSGVLVQAFSFSVIGLTAKAPEKEIYGISKKLELEVIKISFFILLIFLISYPLSQKFLKLPDFGLFLILGLLIVLSFFSTIYSSILQAKLKFFVFSLLIVFQALIKFIFATIFIYLGLKVLGALSGIVISTIAAIFIGRLLIKKYWNNLNKKTAVIKKLPEKFWSFSLLSLLTILGLNSIYSSDILLVRFYFSEFESGIYAAGSIIGKIIFFASTAILLVTFPIFIKNKDNKKKLLKYFNFSFLFLALICLFSVVIYKNHPLFVINLLYGKKYCETANLLFSFSIFVSLLALFNLPVQLLLALKSYWSVFLSLGTTILQIFLIIINHQSLQIIINNSIIGLTSGLFLGLLLAYQKLYAKK